jgi:hypothetical protein
MDRSDVKELYFITPIANVLSIMKHGILSHNLSLKVPHQSIAMSEIQDKRKNKQIPGAGRLHDYANLYRPGFFGHRFVDNHAAISTLTQASCLA